MILFRDFVILVPSPVTTLSGQARTENGGLLSRLIFTNGKRETHLKRLIMPNQRLIKIEQDLFFEFNALLT